MSLLRRALRSVGLRIGKDRYLAGVDLEGNSFYEKPNPEKPDEWRKTKRYVEYAVTRPLSDYNFNTIPVQWSSWLRRTRRTPPTLLELQQDYARQLRLQENVRRLELAHAEEKLRLAAANQAALRLAEPAAADQGLPAKDVGLGPTEAKTAREIGTGEGGHPLRTTAGVKPKEGAEPSAEEAAKRRREEDREAARRRREEFARSAPPTGNPSDSFKPEGWSSQPVRRR
ncbi:hypothetical protein JCM21900_002553 [Sporobolomyces salmonicolor]